jgi:LysM repeat protein
MQKTAFLVALLSLLQSAAWSYSSHNKFLKFTEKDSLFVEVVNGQRYLRHQLKQGQTLYSICKFYAVKPSELYFNNPSLEVNDLRIGQVIRVPMLRAALLLQKNKHEETQAFIPIYYKVKPKETLYRIARVHFQIPVEDLKLRNELQSNDLNEGRHLKIGWIDARGIPDSLQQTLGLTGILGEESNRNQQQYKAAYNGSNEQLAEGIACWDKQMQLSSKNKLYVMSSIIKKGQYIRVENPMTKRFLYAKVVAPKPQNSFTKGALVVLTPTVAKALGALDARFFVRIFYCASQAN